MTMIERINIELRSAKKGERTIYNQRHVALLIEYYEAAEEWMKAVMEDNLLIQLNRLKRARAKLQENE